jgi:exopolysaccharide production protein ExoY
MPTGLLEDAAAAPSLYVREGDRAALFRERGDHASLKIGASRFHRADLRRSDDHRTDVSADVIRIQMEQAVTGPAWMPLPDPAAQARRFLDIAVALVAGVLLSPVIVLISILIALQGDGPILFVQERVGRGGKPFRCLKFRSMVPDAEARLAAILKSDPKLQKEWDRYRKLKRDPRSSKFGEFLRSNSLDEIPQLYNILKGDMSLVGPRPILNSELALYGRWLSCYTSVRPGLTGLWQVSGRNHVSYRRRIAMDRFYVRAFSAKLYVSILLATVPAVLFRRGSY